MSEDDDAESILTTGETFGVVPTISYGLPLETVSTLAKGYENDGIPFVITGIPIDATRGAPADMSLAWLNRLCQLHGNADTRTERDKPPSDLPCPIEWSNWLRAAHIVPSHLVSAGSNDMPLPQGEGDIVLQLGRVEFDSSFQEKSCVVAHDLLCLGDVDASNPWFVTATRSYLDVWEYLRAKDGSNTVSIRNLSPTELRCAPFTVYVHQQKPGDLIVIPPRSFRQKVHQGASASLSWHRITTTNYLESFIYHDQIVRQRLCLTLPFHIKRAICDTLSQRLAAFRDTQASEPHNSSLISGGVQGLQRWLCLFDEVVGPTHCEDDDSLPFVDLGSPPPFCAFCGGELFRSVFCCTGSCIRDNPPKHGPAMITLCEFCFIDGRTCHCGSMAPSRIEALSDLLNLRNNVTEILRSLGVSENREEGRLDESYNHRGFVTFSAGIALCAKRSEVTGNARACTLRTRPSHRVPEPTLINCKFCHAGRCYKHILSTYNVHSSEALLVSLADNTGKTWHALHQSKRDAYGENYAWIKTMVRMGSPASLTDRLVYFASNFSSTTPINQAVSPGFYDTPEADRTSASLDTTASSTSAISKGKRPQRCGKPSSLAQPPPSAEDAETSPSREHSPGFQEKSAASTSQTRSLCPQEVMASTSRKRSSSPQEGSSSGRKRPRFSIARTRSVEAATRGKGQKMLGGSKGVMALRPSNTSRAGGMNALDIAQTEASQELAEGGIASGSESRLPVASYQSPESPRQEHRTSSPLHRPLAYFDPDANVGEGKQTGKTQPSEFRSAWEELLLTHASDSARETAPAEVGHGPPPANMGRKFLGTLSSPRTKFGAGELLFQGQIPHITPPLNTQAEVPLSQDVSRQPQVSQKPGPEKKHIPHSLGARRPSSTKMRPRLVGHLAPRRGQNPGHPATLTRKHSVGRSSTPIPGRSSIPLPSQFPSPIPSWSSTPFPSQSSGQDGTGSIPPRRSITGSSVSAENLAAYIQIMEDSRAKLQGASQSASGSKSDREGQR